jgi:hypothetical protein
MLYRHDVALEHAQSAIFYAQEELVRCEMKCMKTKHKVVGMSWMQNHNRKKSMH